MPFYTFSEKITKIPNIKKFINNNFTKNIKEASAIVGWGKRPTTDYPRLYAEKNNIPYIALEDGFIHSVGQGVLGYHSCSMVIDKTGIYYDATTSSDLELILCGEQKSKITPAIIDKSKNIISFIINNNISKYNNSIKSYQHTVKNKKYILLVDQVAGDMSLKYGYSDNHTFAKMLESALTEHPNAHILIKTHPDVISGKKKGFFNLKNHNSRVTVISSSVNPIELIKNVDHVYVATSQLGFEALLAGKPVTCFGVPFYSGWGVTDDRADKTIPAFKRRRKIVSVEELFAAAYIIYSKYVHPDTNESCEIEQILDHIEINRKLHIKNQGNIYCFGLEWSFWKKKYIQQFLSSPNNNIIFAHSIDHAIKLGFNSESKLLTWGHRKSSLVNGLAETYNINIGHIEDGFIRSVGLGSDLYTPYSLVIDQKGIYYDPSIPSDLEDILQNHQFTEKQIQRAETIKILILNNSISKYNVGKKANIRLIDKEKGQKVILIPGQVEDDISIIKGCKNIKTNVDLIIAVRQAAPNAYIIYKPHPDVVSRNRIGYVPHNITDIHCDLVINDINITDCLAIADEVHTMTSLVGFEALLRNIPVTCYGIPFYSGWGLTTDHHCLPRRTRRINLEQLIFATIVLYPRYINWNNGTFTTPEFVIETLRKQIEKQGSQNKVDISRWNRKLTKLRNTIIGIFYRKFKG